MNYQVSFLLKYHLLYMWVLISLNTSTFYVICSQEIQNGQYGGILYFKASHVTYFDNYTKQAGHLTKQAVQNTFLSVRSTEL